MATSFSSSLPPIDMSHDFEAMGKKMAEFRQMLQETERRFAACSELTLPSISKPRRTQSVILKTRTRQIEPSYTRSSSSPSLLLPTSVRLPPIRRSNSDRLCHKQGPFIV
eukprot:TRINITY_DN5824_c0_g1_i1.p1 TRINITY_DN5824_c0_g1~~TRINITY_DN5824_c0_g1_i1.p1  ORF type:complete len:110 (-),score=7.46 TRINITY_DN5824_c0_g1_i1:71-400(-)